MKKFKLGKYKHYKGNLYEVIGVARHSETLEELVIYQGMYYSDEFGNKPLWVRPKKLFIGFVTIKGKKLPRFEYLGDN